MKKVPFFANTVDGTHCFQACFLMMVKTFRPELEFTYEELDKITNKEPEKWTWPTAGFLWMIDNGFEIKLIEDFDYDKFAAKGQAYVVEKLGKDIAEAHLEHTANMQKEQELAKRFAKFNLVEKRLPSFKDIEKLIKQGYIIMCNINPAALYNHPGFSAHFVLIYECDRKTVTLHDPGLPPKPSLTVSHEQFEKAWAFPTENEKNLLAVKLK